jgi:hypothetical protein
MLHLELAFSFDLGHPFAVARAASLFSLGVYKSMSSNTMNSGEARRDRELIPQEEIAANTPHQKAS